MKKKGFIEKKKSGLERDTEQRVSALQRIFFRSLDREVTGGWGGKKVIEINPRERSEHGLACQTSIFKTPPGK